jgi:hypothetical protein
MSLFSRLRPMCMREPVMEQSCARKFEPPIKSNIL